MILIKKFEIVFVDIDDTLNKKDEEVSQKTKNVLNKVKEKNILVVLNTGRCLSYAIDKSKEANASSYVISSNGTEVYDYKNDKVIFQKVISTNTVKEIYNFALEHNITIVLNSLMNRFISNNKYKIDGNPILINDIDDVLNNNKISQIVLISSNYDRMLVVPNIYLEKFSNIKVISSSNNLRNNKRGQNEIYFHNIISDTTSKSTGMVELLDYLNIDERNSMAIGNGVEDLSMMDIVNTKVAVENSCEELKKIADYVSDSAKNDGVAKILENLILESSDYK